MIEAAWAGGQVEATDPRLGDNFNAALAKALGET